MTISRPTTFRSNHAGPYWYMPANYQFPQAVHIG
jgi:hypothetical protein